ncbi:MAG: HD-GYP domain-containing protein [Rhodocyclaceae bacterium]|nr:HD-GYP domain-containing protein [Rhodocyclaceae bacterium]
MLKQIPLEKLQAGMYVDLKRISWLDHSFIGNGLLITDDATLRKVQAAGWEQVTIDTNRGKDLDDASSIIEVPPSAPRVKEVEFNTGGAPVSYQTELPTARSIHERASEVIRSLMHEARAGQLGAMKSVETLADDMVNSILRNSSALISLTSLKHRDDYTFMHCVSVGIFMIGLGRQLGLDTAQLRMLGAAGLLHDVGKAYIPLDVLNKPGSLSPLEGEIMRAHPRLGYDALIGAGYTVETVLDAVLHHHERLDGSGYPEAFSGNEISLISRIASVADVYDAVTSQRVYHSAMAPTAALRMIRKRAGIDFDSTVAQALIKVVGIYPIGSLVRLSSGHLAVVSEQDALNSTKPKVMAFYSLKKDAYITPLPIDLAATDDAIESDEDPAEWGVDLRRYWHL